MDADAQISVLLCFCLFFCDPFAVFWIWFGGRAPIIPMKGLPEGFVQLLVHGSHYPISIRTRGDRLVVCMIEEPLRSLADRCLD